MSLSDVLIIAAAIGGFITLVVILALKFLLPKEPPRD